MKKTKEITKTRMTVKPTASYLTVEAQANLSEEVIKQYADYDEFRTQLVNNEVTLTELNAVSDFVLGLPASLCCVSYEAYLDRNYNLRAEDVKPTEKASILDEIKQIPVPVVMNHGGSDIENCKSHIGIFGNIMNKVLIAGQDTTVNLAMRTWSFKLAIMYKLNGEPDNRDLPYSRSFEYLRVTCNYHDKTWNIEKYIR